MSDQVAGDLARFAIERKGAPPEVLHEAGRRLLDVYALALVSRNDRPVSIARSLASQRKDDSSVSIWGTPGAFSLDDAVLANGVGARYRDMNDAYFNKESLHPSDLIPALCGVAETVQASAAELYEAICVAYDVAVDMADVWRTASRFADHVNIIRFAVVAGAGRLRRFDADVIANALAITATTQVATRQTRRGQLSMWKGYAAADHSVGALRALRLAEAGVEGPPDAFVGDNGFQAIAVDPALWVDSWQRPTDRWRITDTHLKTLPLGYLGQAPAQLGMQLHTELDGRVPTAIRIHTYRRASEIMGDKAKWSITSSETADHSLPYVTLAALLDGNVSVDSMLESRWSAADVRELLPRVQVIVDDAMTADYPNTMAARLEVDIDGSDTLVAETSWPLGHARNPLPDDALLARAASMVTELDASSDRQTLHNFLDPDWQRPASYLWRS